MTIIQRKKNSREGKPPPQNLFSRKGTSLHTTLLGVSILTLLSLLSLVVPSSCVLLLKVTTLDGLFICYLYPTFSH